MAARLPSRSGYAVKPGRVVFVGCGPGAPDLLTLRAAEAIASADVVVWGRSLLAEAAVTAHARPGAEIVPWPPATLADVLDVYDRARDQGLVVARLKSGDPSLFGEMEPELSAVKERELAWEVVPGVSAVGAAAALAGSELAAGGDVVLAAADRPAGAPTVALFMAGPDPGGTAAALTERGVPPDAPCAIVHRASWPGELVSRCRLEELAERLEDLRLDGTTLVLAFPPQPPPPPAG